MTERKQGAATSGGNAWTAIVLAGSRPGESDFARGLGYPAKALIRVGG